MELLHSPTKQHFYLECEPIPHIYPQKADNFFSDQPYSNTQQEMPLQITPRLTPERTFLHPRWLAGLIPTYINEQLCNTELNPLAPLFSMPPSAQPPLTELSLAQANAEPSSMLRRTVGENQQIMRGGAQAMLEECCDNYMLELECNTAPIVTITQPIPNLPQLEHTYGLEPHWNIAMGGNDTPPPATDALESQEEWCLPNFEHDQATEGNSGDEDLRQGEPMSPPPQDTRQLPKSKKSQEKAKVKMPRKPDPTANPPPARQPQR